MPVEPKEEFGRPAWNQAALWTGTDFFGLLRILGSNRWRVRPAYLPECVIDLGFGAGHTCLKGVQRLIYRSRIRRVELERDPLFVVGHWRTGTTLMHELLALDPQHNYPTTFQCFAPNHFLLSERFLKRWTNFALPSNRPSDDMKMGWDLPQEDEFALCNLGIPSPYATIAFPNHPPQNQEYLELDTLPREQLQRWKNALLWFLKQLRYKRAGRIVLKSPTHTFRLPVLLEMFPNAQFVYMVRDPIAVFMSTIRLWKSLYAAHGYQKPDFSGLEEHVYETFTRMHERWQATRDRIPTGHLVEVRFEDLVGDPVGQARTVYEQLDLGDFEPVRPEMESYVAERAGYQASRHEPTPEIRQEVHSRWKPYFEQYGYEA